MPKRYSKDNNERGSAPDWLEKDPIPEEREKAYTQDPPPPEPEEKVVPHTPSRNKEERPKWAYTLTEGGKKHYVELPRTDAQIRKVKQQLKNSKNWRRYHKNPYGGDVRYTQINCFPPFDYMRVAEVYLPTGEVWKSSKRKFINPKDN